MRALRADLRRALSSKGFLAGAAGLVAACLIACWSETPEVFDARHMFLAGETFQLLLQALRSQTVVLVAPLLAALAYTASFVEDLSTRYLREYLPRCGQKTFLRSRTLSVALAGGLTLAAGVAVSLLIFLVLFMPSETVTNVPDEIEWAAQTRREGAVQIIQTVLLFFVSGALWSLVGALLSALTMNRYMAYAGPFVFYFLLVILAERYFMEATALNPKEWLAPGEAWGIGWAGPLPLATELMAAAALAFWLTMEKRIENA